MWCKNCNIETNYTKCAVCGSQTEEIVPVVIYWCKDCRAPIIQKRNQVDKGKCPLCNKKTKYLTTDVRPVFPEERLLLEALLDKEPFTYKNNTVWANNNRYYIDGRPISIPVRLYRELDVNRIIAFLNAQKENNTYETFEEQVETFIAANKIRLNALKDEAYRFIQQVATDFSEERVVISFSGGKDSTVTSDLVTKALSNPYLVHIFGNTTLEFPSTLEYADRFRKTHQEAIFQVAQNYDQDFYEVCKDIGPPARMMRWCCSMFKTGPISRVINSLYRNKRILTFYGIRRSESVSRSKYKRVEDSADAVKIQQQTVASPIFFWQDADIWLYIFDEKIDFNDAYRLGYDRVGCWCCPNNSERGQFLSRIYMPKLSKRWRYFLIDFARQMGKPDAEIYVDTGKWKARQGGNGLSSAQDVKIRFTNCTSEEHAQIYKLTRPFNDEFVGMLTPFGRIAPELGKKLLNEVIVLDIITKMPILSVQPIIQDGYEYAVKVKTMNIVDHDNLQRMVSYQIKKFNACRKCLKCESICKTGAIKINSDGYFIDPNKCIRCKDCVTAKYIDGGCTMDRYLRTK